MFRKLYNILQMTFSASPAFGGVVKTRVGDCVKYRILLWDAARPVDIEIVRPVV
jgi:hypothetical protein